jgi:hypothetical protein
MAATFLLPHRSPTDEDHQHTQKKENKITSSSPYVVISRYRSRLQNPDACNAIQPRGWILLRHRDGTIGTTDLNGRRGAQYVKLGQTCDPKNKKTSQFGQTRTLLLLLLSLLLFIEPIILILI